MRLIVGLVGIFGAFSANAGCVSIDNDQQRLSCFDQLAQCRSVESDDERLHCYQQGGAEVPVSLSSSEASSAVTPAGRVTATTAAVEAAFPAPRSADIVEGESPEIHSTIVASQKGARGYYYLTLANGHIWLEKESVRNRYSEGDQVIISKGAFNSNHLRLVGKGRIVRVERYK